MTISFPPWGSTFLWAADGGGHLTHLSIPIFGLFCRLSQKTPPLPVFAGAPWRWWHERMCVVGAAWCRHLPVLFKAQGASGTSLGPAERQPQKNDLPKNGSSSAQLWQNGWDPQGEKEAHVPVWDLTAEPITFFLKPSRLLGQNNLQWNASSVGFLENCIWAFASMAVLENLPEVLQ